MNATNMSSNRTAWDKHEAQKHLLLGAEEAREKHREIRLVTPCWRDRLSSGSKAWDLNSHKVCFAFKCIAQHGRNIDSRNFVVVDAGE